MSRITSAEQALLKANSLFVDENFEEALQHYNLAIELDNQNVESYLKRSVCLHKLGKFTESLADANSAIKLNPDTSFLSKAYLRKGMACFELEEYESAKSSFEKGQQLDASNSQFRTWIRKCDAELDNESGATSMVVDKQPSTPVPTSTSSTSTPASTPSTSTSPTPTPTPITTLSPSTSSTPAIPKPAEKIRHEWYQTNTHVFVTIFAKNVKKEDCTIDLQEKSLSASITLSDANEYQLNFELFDKVVPLQSTISYLSTKIEIKMKKVNQIRWKTFEDTGENVPPPAPVTPTSDAAISNGSSKVPAAYTTKKNWDKIAKEVAEEKLEGEESLNKLFQDIYSNGSDEQKRAMMKSFLESNGTVLSTNWDEVGKGEVKGSPPEGMEMHKWSELEKPK